LFFANAAHARSVGFHNCYFTGETQGQETEKEI
jgi:hypothetical protein